MAELSIGSSQVRWPTLATLTPAMLLLALLSLQLPADPAAGVTASNSPFTDEAWNVMASRNLVLLGDWSAGNWALHLVQLPFTVLEALTFAVLGVGIVQARLAATLCTVLSVALIALLVRRRLGTAAAILAAAGLASSSLVLYYGRLAYLENLVMLGLAGGAAVLFWGAMPAGRLRAVAAGLLLAIAVGTKALAVFPVAGLLLGSAFAARHRRPRELLLVVAVIALAGLGWFALIALPNMRQIGWAMEILAAQTPPHSPLDTVTRIGTYLLTNDGALAMTLPLAAAGVGGVVAAVARWSRLDDAQRALAGGAIGWLAADVALLLVASYRPNRYVLPILPALAIMSGYLVPTVREILRRLRGSLVRLAVATAAVACLVVPGLVAYAGWASQASAVGPVIQADALEAMNGLAVEGGLAAFIAMRVPAPIYVHWSTSSVNTGDLYTDAGVRWVVITGAYRPTWADAHVAAWDARRQVFCAAWGRGRHCLVRLP